MTDQQELQMQNEQAADQNGGAADFVQSGQQPGVNLKLAEATIRSPSDIQVDDQISQATDAQTILLQNEMNSILHHLKHRRIVNDPVPTQKTHNTSNNTNTNFHTSSFHSQPKSRVNFKYQRARHSRADADSPTMKGPNKHAYQVQATVEAFTLDQLESSQTTTNLNYEQRKKNQSRRRRLQSAKPFLNRENPRNSLALQALSSKDTIGTLNASKAIATKLKADSSINIETHLNKIRVQ